MADGILCKHCGYQETEHEHFDYVDEPWKKVKGYRKTFAQCRGYVGEREPSASPREFSYEQMCWYEKRGEESAAWGLYGAMLRQADLDKRIEAADREIRLSQGSARNSIAVARKEALLDDAQRENARYLHIGPY